MTYPTDMQRLGLDIVRQALKDRKRYVITLRHILTDEMAKEIAIVSVAYRMSAPAMVWAGLLAFWSWLWLGYPLIEQYELSVTIRGASALIESSVGYEVINLSAPGSVEAMGIAIIRFFDLGA